MSRSGIPLLGYALIMALDTAVLWAWGPGWLPVVLIGGATALTGLIGAALLAARRPASPPAVEPIPDYSFSMVAVAFALCTMLVGAYLGLYLILVGAGVLVLGLGGLVREARAERRALRRAAAAAAGVEAEAGAR